MPNRFLQLNGRRDVVTGGLTPALKKAHELLASGKYDAAAVTFESLARRVESRDGVRAPHLYLQAGRARLLMGQVASGLAHTKYGLTMLAERKRYAQLYRAGQRVVQELKARGLEKEARDITNLVNANMPAIADIPTERMFDITKVNLPVSCPSCGGPIRAEEVDWVSSDRIECMYCGSQINLE